MKFRILSAVVVFCVSSLISAPLRAADPPSEADRLRNLENAVRQLQERNAELENEVRELKSKGGPFRPMFSGPEQKAVAGSESKDCCNAARRMTQSRGAEMHEASVRPVSGMAKFNIPSNAPHDAGGTVPGFGSIGRSLLERRIHFVDVSI